MSDLPETETGAAFAAGVATATAEQAAADAAGAEAQAAVAASEAAQAADAARVAAAAAETEGWSARAAVDELRAEVLALRDELTRKPAADEPGPGDVPAPERKETAPADTVPAAEDKPARSYGASSWFGKR